MEKILLILAVVFCCISCNSSISNQSMGIKVIEVDKYSNNSNKMNDLYFKKVKYIPLETNQNSLINEVNGIILHNNKVYIFDKRQNAVLVFNDTGEYVKKISSIGKGPGEYISLRDFKITTYSDGFVLLCDSPNKLIFYRDSTFTEFELKHYYSSILKIKDNKIFLLTESFETDYFVHEYNISNGEMVNKYQKKKPNTKTYGMVQSVFPKSLSSSETYFMDPYDNNVYMVSDTGVYSSYQINFLDQNLEDRLNTENVEIEDVYQFCVENKLGGFISNFRELKNHVFFTFGPNNIVIYDKNTKKSQILGSSIEDHQTIGLYLSSFYGHNGDDDCVLNLFSPDILVKYRMAPISDEELKLILTNIKVSDNPVIGVYTIENK